MASLNPAAPEFTPSSWRSESTVGDLAEASEERITPEELEELEAAEAWVAAMVDCEEEEEVHLVAVALRYAPEEKLAEIQRRFGVPAGEA